LKDRRLSKFLLSCMILLFLAPNLIADYPKRTGRYINDYVNLLSPKTEAQLNSELSAFHKESGIEIAVVTIYKYMDYKTADFSWESFATSLFNQWAIGSIPENRGVLLLISTGDRRIRIELGAGYHFYHDGVAQTIIDKRIAPYLKRGDFERGITFGVKEIMLKAPDKFLLFRLYQWPLAIVLVIALSLLVEKRNQKLETPGAGWIALGLLGAILIGSLGELRMMLSSGISRSDTDSDWIDHDGWGGSSGGGFSSGGFGGGSSGGGFSSGGGASGSF